MRAAILNAGGQTDYLYGLVSGLAAIETLTVDVVDADDSIGLFDQFPSVTFHNLRRGQRPTDPLLRKALGIILYYARLKWFALTTKAKVLHIQWENSFVVLDRTVLIFFYKLLGKKVVWTAHNIYKEERDGYASPVRFWSLKVLYRTVDRIIVHTQGMKQELCRRFSVDPAKVHVIPHGVNNRVAVTGLSREEARRRLGIPADANMLLFFGYVDRYKGVDLLLESFALLSREDQALRLVIAGMPKRGAAAAEEVRQQIQQLGLTNVRADLQFIPTEEVEAYFTAADCLVMPYRRIFQSGVIFLAWRFGLPIVATDVATLREDVRDGDTGFTAKENTAEGFADAVRTFFASDLYRDREGTRRRIREAAERSHSWTAIASQTAAVYAAALTEPDSAER
jgi:glycosyltransferase involved in cell wall biosynthesis